MKGYTMKSLLIALTFLFAATASSQDYFELLRQDVKTTKVAILTESLPMTQKESDAFWPIYRAYDLELSKIGDRRIAGIKNYAKVYDNMTDSAAVSLVEVSFKLQEDRLDLLMDTFKKVSKATNPQLAARFMQIENQIITLLDMKIIEEVPLIEKGAKSGKEKK
jgi:hypothetical protein